MKEPFVSDFDNIVVAVEEKWERERWNWKTDRDVNGSESSQRDRQTDSALDLSSSNNIRVSCDKQTPNLSIDGLGVAGDKDQLRGSSEKILRPPVWRKTFDERLSDAFDRFGLSNDSIGHESCLVESITSNMQLSQRKSFGHDNDPNDDRSSIASETSTPALSNQSSVDFGRPSAVSAQKQKLFVHLESKLLRRSFDSSESPANNLQEWCCPPKETSTPKNVIEDLELQVISHITCVNSLLLEVIF
jgi:hypothetical protein